MTHRGSILLIDDEEILREELSGFLQQRGWSVEATGDGGEGLRRILEADHDVVITDLRLQSSDGLSIVEAAHHRMPDAAVVVITAHSSVRSAIEAFRRGATDYVVKPIVFEDLLGRVQRSIDLRRLRIENRALRRFLDARREAVDLVGRSAAMARVLERIRRVGLLDGAVLLRGEKGTGKERIARAIHAAGSRRDGPFLAVQCRAIPVALFESTLFGHVRGAVAGTADAGDGIFRAVRGGTIFLDEVASFPVDLQAKLLRLLDERRLVPVGGTFSLEIDARVIAATSEDLEAAVSSGRFRADLFHRLSAFPIEVPALRDRPEDIPDLVEHLVRRFNSELGLSIRGVDREALAGLSAGRWEGNVGELLNVVLRAMVLCQGGALSCRDLSVAAPGPTNLEELPLVEAVKRFERAFIERALLAASGSRQETAIALGISSTALWRRMRELEIVDESAETLQT